MIQFRAEQTIYGISLVCLALFCNNLIEVQAQEMGNETANNETSPNVPPSNSEPLADAGIDATYTEGEEFFVDGSASSDADGDKLSYFWKQLTPLSPTLDIKSGSANFYSKAPEVTDNTVFELELTIEDGKGGKDSDEVKITIQDMEDSETSFLSRPKSDATATKGEDDTLLPSTSSALIGSALPKNGKNDTLLPSASTALRGSSLAGDSKNDTLLPSASRAASSATASSDTLLPTIDELTQLEESEPGSKSDIKGLDVVAVGDFGCKEPAADTVETIKSLSPDITLALGDFSYEPSADCWLSLVKPIENNLKLVKGNHDIEPPEIWNQYISNVNSEGSASSKTSKLSPVSDGYYYQLSLNAVHFLVMDSEVPLGMDSPQYKYVKNDLEKASSNPDIKWIVVSLHRPVYYGEQYLDIRPVVTIAGDKNIASILKEVYHPLFDKYGVDMVLAGHAHNYQRSYPLKYNGPSEPIKTSSEKEKYENPTNPIFLTIGTGGVEPSGSALHEAVKIDELPSFIATTNGKDNVKGVLEIRFSKDSSNLEGTFHTNDGNVLDRFSIFKNNDLSSAMLVPPS